MSAVPTSDAAPPVPAASPEPPPYVQAPLRNWWRRPVAELVGVRARELTAGMRERHRIYSLLVMALVHRYWNGNKRGQEGEYPWRARQRRPDNLYEGGQYLGHNIACTAVDGAGELIDFDFNHNEILSSSAEHAESRLVRRVFSLAQIHDNWETRDPSVERRPTDYSNILSNVTIYTSLESCSQCSGIMALGQVREVVYLHRDTGMYFVGNILFNLTHGTKLPAPYPTPADAFGFSYFDELNAAFEAFRTAVAEKPFYIGKDGYKDASSSVTSFLCTDEAFDIYTRAAAEFTAYTVAHPDYKPVEETATPAAQVLTNAAVLAQAKRFFAYARSDGRRGTPHKL